MELSAAFAGVTEVLLPAERVSRWLDRGSGRGGLRGGGAGSRGAGPRDGPRLSYPTSGEFADTSRRQWRGNAFSNVGDASAVCTGEVSDKGGGRSGKAEASGLLSDAGAKLQTAWSRTVGLAAAAGE